MKRKSRAALQLLTGTLIIVVAAGIAGAAEMRKWTNLKGQTIEAKLLSVDAESVNLQLENGSRATVPRNSLSAADQQYLTEYGGAKELEIDPDAKISVPEKDMRFDSKTVVNRDDRFILPGDFSLEFKMIESEHFFIMTSGSVRGGDTAELAERLWYGMSFYHPGFKAKWGDKKRAIFLCGEKEDYLTLGEYHARNLVLLGQGNSADNSKLTWPRASSSGLRLTDEICDEYNLDPNARPSTHPTRRASSAASGTPSPPTAFRVMSSGR